MYMFVDLLKFDLQLEVSRLTQVIWNETTVLEKKAEGRACCVLIKREGNRWREQIGDRWQAGGHLPTSRRGDTIYNIKLVGGGDRPQWMYIPYPSFWKIQNYFLEQLCI